MQALRFARKGAGPRGRQRRHSYDEDVNESAKLIEDEPVEVEYEQPAEENSSEQRITPDDPPPPAPFEE
jgi:hypothetical protein